MSRARIFFYKILSAYRPTNIHYQSTSKNKNIMKLENIVENYVTFLVVTFVISNNKLCMKRLDLCARLMYDVC